jgi:hypothetical protein
LSTIGMRYIDNMEFGEKYITFNTTLGFLIWSFLRLTNRSEEKDN